MLTNRRTALLALAAAGALWGLTVPLSKLALEWLGPAWLTVARFAVAAPLLALVARGRLRAALTPGIALAGALGYGGVILLQNAGIERTSVSHAALIVGAVPVLVALIAAALGRAAARPVAWVGYAIAIGGLALVAGGGGSGASASGDLLVLVSVAGSAGFIVAQPRLLEGRDPAAVTAVELTAGALAVLPAALIAEGAPSLPAGMTAVFTADGASSLLAALIAGGAPVAAWVGLALAGTALPFWLFAFGQARVQAEVAGVFVNLEPLVGAAAGWIAYHEAVTAAQLGGGAALLAGIALSALAGGRAGRTRAVDGPPQVGGEPTRRRWPAPARPRRNGGRVPAMTILSTATQTRRLPVGHAYCVPVVREMPRPLSAAGDSTW